MWTPYKNEYSGKYGAFRKAGKYEIEYHPIGEIFADEYTAQKFCDDINAIEKEKQTHE